MDLIDDDNDSQDIVLYVWVVTQFHLTLLVIFAGMAYHQP